MVEGFHEAPLAKKLNNILSFMELEFGVIKCLVGVLIIFPTINSLHLVYFHI